MKTAAGDIKDDLASTASAMTSGLRGNDASDGRIFEVEAEEDLRALHAGASMVALVNADKMKPEDKRDTGLIAVPQKQH